VCSARVPENRHLCQGPSQPVHPIRMNSAGSFACSPPSANRNPATVENTNSLPMTVIGAATARALMELRQCRVYYHHQFGQSFSGGYSENPPDRGSPFIDTGSGFCNIGAMKHQRPVPPETATRLCCIRSNPNRLATIEGLLERPRCPGKIAGRLGLDKSEASTHLTWVNGASAKPCPLKMVRCATNPHRMHDTEEARTR